VCFPQIVQKRFAGCSMQQGRRSLEAWAKGQGKAMGALSQPQAAVSKEARAKKAKGKAPYAVGIRGNESKGAGDDQPRATSGEGNLSASEGGGLHFKTEGEDRGPWGRAHRGGHRVLRVCGGALHSSDGVGFFSAARRTSPGPSLAPTVAFATRLKNQPPPPLSPRRAGTPPERSRSSWRRR